MLSSEAHISIDGTEFMLFEDTDLPFPYYQHNLEPIFVGRQDISGKPGRQNVRPDLTLWALDDWSGGEGGKVFDPDVFTKYDVGSGNPRVAGRLKGRPERRSAALSAVAASRFDGSQLTTVVGSPTYDSERNPYGAGVLHSEAVLKANLDEVEKSGRTPGANPVIVRFFLYPLQAYRRQRHGSELATTAGTTSVIGNARRLDQTGDQAAWTAQNLGGGTRVRVAFVLTRGISWHPVIFAPVSLQYKCGIYNETDTVDVVTTGTIVKQLNEPGSSVDQVTHLLEFTAVAGKNYRFYVNADFFDPNAGSAFVDIGEIQYELNDDQADYRLVVRNTTDNVDVGGTVKTGTLTGLEFVEVTFTGVAGKTYAYRARSTDALADDVVVDYIEEVVGGAGTYAPGEVHMANTRDATWIAFGDQLSQSLDGVTWTTRGYSVITAGMKAAGIAADDDYLYVIMHSNHVSGATGTIEILRVTGALSGGNWTSERMFGPGGTFGFPISAAVAPGIRRIFIHAISHLVSWDVSAAAPWPAQENEHVIGATGAISKLATEVIASDDNSVIYLSSSKSRSIVYQYKNGVGRTLWFPPYGVTFRAIAYNQGVVMAVAGDVDGSLPGINIYALNLAQGQTSFLGRYRDNVAGLAPTTCSPGTDNTFLIGDNQGNFYVYDLDTAALSLLDEGLGGPVVAANTFLRRRIAGVNTSVSVVTASSFEPDESIGQGDFSLDSGIWDLDFPESEKTLHGFSVHTKPLDPGQEVEIFYQTDEGGLWTSAGTFSDSGQSYKFIEAPSGTSTVRFRTLKVRMVGTKGTAASAPEVLSVTTQISISQKTETWDLALRVTNESDGKRPTNVERSAEVIRDALLAIASNNSKVELRDGYRRGQIGDYTTHTVTIESVGDIIQKEPEGYIKVRLKSAAS